MSKNHYKFLLAGIFLCVAIFTIFWWNERQKASSVPSHEPYRIEVIFKSYNRPPTFWTLVGDGVLAAQEEFGVSCNITAPYYESDIQTQITLVEQAIERRPNAIILAATDYDRLAPVCQKAVEAGITLLTVDSDVNYDRRAAFIGTDNVEIGRKLAQLMHEQIGDEKPFGVISHVEGTTTATERLQGLLEMTPGAEARMLGFDYCEGSEELSEERTIQMLTEHPEIRCMVGLNESSALGVARALQKMGLAGQVSLVVCDSSEKQIQFLENGTIQACVVQNPFSMGYLSVVNIIKLLEHKSVEPVIHTDSVIVRKKDLGTASYQQLIIPFSP